MIDHAAHNTTDAAMVNNSEEYIFTRQSATVQPDAWRATMMSLLTGDTISTVKGVNNYAAGSNIEPLSIMSQTIIS